MRGGSDMFTVVITEKGGAKRRIEFAQPEVSIGRVQGNDIILRKGNVSKRHARLVLKNDDIELTDLNSTNGTYVNGRKVASPRLIAVGDKIYIADFILTVELNRGARVGPPAAPVPVTDAPPPPVPQPSMGTFEGSMPMSQQSMDDALPMTADNADSIAKPLPEPLGSQIPLTDPRATTAVPAMTPAISGLALSPLAGLMQRLGERFDVHITEPSSMKDQGRWNAAQAAISQTLQALQTEGIVSADVDAQALGQIALHEAVGLGTLDHLLSDESVQEIVVRGTTEVLVDRGEGLQAAHAQFSSRVMLQTIARRLAAQAGRRLGQQAIFHGVLAFGPQVTIIQAPLAVDGPIIEIRSNTPLSLEDLTAQERLSSEAQGHLEAAVEANRNIVVIGPQDSGVSTTLSALATALTDSARPVAVEAVPDLSVDRTRIVSLCCANTDITLAELIREASRLRVDRLIIDDVTGNEVREALTALGSREPGHILGVHAPVSADPVTTLVDLVESAGFTRDSASRLVASTVHMVVQVRLTHEGHRVLSIMEVTGLQKGKVGTKVVYAQN